MSSMVVKHQRQLSHSCANNGSAGKTRAALAYAPYVYVWRISAGVYHHRNNNGHRASFRRKYRVGVMASSSVQVNKHHHVGVGVADGDRGRQYGR